MTVIIGIKDSKGCVIGSDSFVFTGNVINRTTEGKIIRVGNVVIGNSGAHSLMGNILGNIKDFPKKNSESCHEYLIKKLIPFIQKINDTLNVEYDNVLLVGIDNRLFAIHSDYAITEPDTPFWAVGSGVEVALGVLHCKYSDDANIEKLITETISITNQILSSCGGSIAIKKNYD